MTPGYEPNMVLSTKEYDVVGKRPIRHDGADKVTGNARYGADYQATGTLYGAILRSPHAHARIRSIDTSKAEALSGVRAVVTERDFPDRRGRWHRRMEADERVKLGEATFDMKNLRDGVMAFDKARFKGHPIAGVAAVSPHVAAQAAKLIEVDYEVLPAVMTVHEAMKEGAPLVHEDPDDGGVRREARRAQQRRRALSAQAGRRRSRLRPGRRHRRARARHGHRPPGLHRAP